MQNVTVDFKCANGRQRAAYPERRMRHSGWRNGTTSADPERDKSHLQAVPDEEDDSTPLDKAIRASRDGEHRETSQRERCISHEIQKQVRLLRDSAQVITHSPTHPSFEEPEFAEHH